MYRLYEHSQVVAVVEGAGERCFDMSNKFLLVKGLALIRVFKIVVFRNTSNSSLFSKPVADYVVSG